MDEGYARIGTKIQEPGFPVGRGLEAGAARELGLPTGTPVATAIIDAHAGGIGKGSSLTKSIDLCMLVECAILTRWNGIHG